MQIVVLNGIPYYIGKRGSQCECGCLDIEYHVNEDMDEWYDFTCHTLPEGLILQRI